MFSVCRASPHLGTRGPATIQLRGGAWRKTTFTAQKLSGAMDRKRSLTAPRMIYTTLELWQQITRLKCEQTHKSKKKFTHHHILLTIFLALLLGSNKIMFPSPSAQWGGIAPGWPG